MSLKKFWPLILLSAVLVLGLGSPVVAQEKDPVTGEVYPEVFRVGSFSNAPQTGVPIEEGFFDTLPAKIKIVFFDSGRDINTAFASGSIDAATFGSSPISLGVSNQLGYEVIFINSIIGSAESLAVRKSSGITTITELKGKKVATPFASTAHYSLLAALVQNGVQPSEVTILDLPTQDILAAWLRGDIDGAYVWTPVLEELINNDGLVLTDSLKLAQKGTVTADVTVVNQQFGQKYPTLVKAYVEAFVKANVLINEKPEQAAAALAKHIGIDASEAAKQLEGHFFVPLPEQTSPERLGTKGQPGDFAKTLKETADFHVTQGNLDRAGDLSIYQAAVNGAWAEELRQK
ncbi:MAG: ABC transporter substrate-binding protein [Deltaproteobacteria bacterium]|jgi:taurine transport system substrate-binding protein|nr:ABC transporter substrate-binding protein [Deltaproteobacteria bacterium]